MSFRDLGSRTSAPRGHAEEAGESTRRGRHSGEKAARWEEQRAGRNEPHPGDADRREPPE
jgi:hypothetical protein